MCFRCHPKPETPLERINRLANEREARKAHDRWVREQREIREAQAATLREEARRNALLSEIARQKRLEEQRRKERAALARLEEQARRQRERERERRIRELNLGKEVAEFRECAEYRVINTSFNVHKEMEQLFSRLDTQKDGYISSSSFSTWFGNPIHFLRQQFDKDGDQRITPEEFQRGFFETALTANFRDNHRHGTAALPHAMTIEQALNWVEKKANIHIRDLMTEVKRECPPDKLRSRAILCNTPRYEETHTGVFTSCALRENTLLKFASKYLELDKSRKGFITRSDLPSSHRHSWGSVLEYFDTDNNTVITRDEYVQGGVRLALQQQLDYPADGQLSIATLLKQITGQVNDYLEQHLDHWSASLLQTTNAGTYTFPNALVLGKRKRHQEYNSNEIVNIKKAGTHNGCKAIVTDPNWAHSGFVKVVMTSGPHKGRTKSYKKAELTKR